MFYNSTTTIIAEFLGNKTWVDPAIVEANHRYWYCAACALVLGLWQARMLNKPPTPHPVKLEEKLGMPTLVAGIGWVAGISNMITKFYDPEQHILQF